MSNQDFQLSFLGLEKPFDDPVSSRHAVLPVPFERTTSYGRGAAGGPAAILEASQQVELYDEELDSEPYKSGICTLPTIVDQGQTAADYLDQLSSVCQDELRSGRFLLCLGGEHTLTQACVAASAAVHGSIGVVQFDAHADLRDSYDGDRFSHACVMRRVHDMAIPHIGVGIRSMSPEEAQFVVAHQEPEIIWGRELEELTPSRFQARLQSLPEKVYLTFDVDFFDPSVVPATGTPEPGGGSWWPSLALLRTLFEVKQVVAMDVVELAPIAGQAASDFTVARLAYKCIAYADAARYRRETSAG